LTLFSKIRKIDLNQVFFPFDPTANQVNARPVTNVHGGYKSLVLQPS